MNIDALVTSPPPNGILAGYSSGAVIFPEGDPMLVGPSSTASEWYKESYQINKGLYEFDKSIACQKGQTGIIFCGQDTLPDADAIKFNQYKNIVITGRKDFECSMFGTDPEKDFDRATELLSKMAILELGVALESELWSGAKTRDAVFSGTLPGLPTSGDNYQFLNNMSNTARPIHQLTGPGQPVILSEAVGLLEEYLGCCGFVGPGIIHIPMRYYSDLGDKNFGNLGVSPLGHFYMTSCGYSSVGPLLFPNLATPPASPTSYWIYGTSRLEAYVHVADPTTSMALLDNKWAASINYAGTFGWDCCHAAVEVKVC